MPTSPLPLLILDVDGVLTDGDLPFDERGCEDRTFFVQDGAALAAWRRAGGRFALLSGRTAAAVTRRAAELKADEVLQGIDDKLAAFRGLCEKLGVRPDDVCYVGDDWADLPVMRACGTPIAVANAIPAVKREAVRVTRRRGGAGAVAEVVEHLLRRAGRWPPGA